MSLSKLTLSPNQINFGTVLVGTASESQVVTAVNEGQVVLRISGISALGEYSEQNDCPVSLAPGEACHITVVFKPTTAGSLTGAIAINDTAGAAKQFVPLVGIGETASAPVANAGGPYSGTAGQAITFDGSKSTAPGGQTLTYAWSFGDGSTGSGVSPTHSYINAGSYTVTLSVTDAAGATNSATSSATITNPAPVANAGGPYSGTTGQAIAFDGSKSTAPSGQSLTYAWNFGDSSTGTGVSPTHTYSSPGSYTVTLKVTDTAGATGSGNATATIAAPLGPPTISGFAPASGPIGTVVTVSGKNLTGTSGPAPAVTLAQQGGGTLSAPVSAFTATSLSFVIPPGAATGAFQVAVGTQNATSSSALTVTTSSNFTLGVTPGTGQLIQGQSTALAVTIGSSNGFSGTAALTVKGVPSGVTATFKPTAIAAGQTSVLTLAAPPSQATGTSALTVTAAATIDDQSISQTATASLKVTAVSTSFLGRTVVDDAQETPIAGVTVKFLGVTDKGNPTGCSGTTTSDGGGNFSMTNLSAACVGPQLIGYDGNTATAPAGKYAGVNLSYTLVSGQVVASPVLVHLPRIDNAETVQVQQNSATDQIFTFSSIPGLQVTVYAGTTIALDDGSKPNPFPLTALDIPLDRLPERIPTNGMLMGYVVAFQPANATASQPVAVTFPNPLAIAPATSAMLTTLDPTRGYMVPYGTTTVSNDGRDFIPDMDPSHPGHRYGLVHFDWHSPLSGNQPTQNTGCDCATAGNPVDLASGIETFTSTDIQIRGGRGSIGINRTYRSLNPNAGPFGIGTGHNYSYALNTVQVLDGLGVVTLIQPNGNQYPMSMAADGTYLNGTVPQLRGTVLSLNQTSGVHTLRFVDGTTYTFTVFPQVGSGGAFLTAITDLNGNTTTLTRDPSQPLRLLTVTDPVGRSLNLTYDGSNRITKITDPIGRMVKYTYNGQGTLATFTDANGGISSYTYDTQNNLTSVTDPRGVITEQNTYDESFDGRLVQQVQADGGVAYFNYTLLNPSVPTSPVLQTILTDPLGNQSIYRFNTAGMLVSATDPSGQTKTLIRDATHNNLVTSYLGAAACIACGDPSNGDVTFTYDAVGNVLTQTNALGATVAYGYDSRFGQVVSIVDPLSHVVTLTYDARGNPITITDPNTSTTHLTYDSFGEVTLITDPSGAQTAVTYDDFGNVASITDALGRTTSLSYDAASRLTHIVDSAGHISTATYDSLDRISTQTDPNGSTASYSYDAVGNLVSATDARGYSTTYSYDPLSRLTTRLTPLGETETYTYDHDSNLVQQVDRRGQLSTFTYDEMNRLVSETYPDATVTRRYDLRGRILSAQDSQGGGFSFNYDLAGHLLTQAEPTGVVNYTLDTLGRVVTRQVAGQKPVTYSYDPAGNLLSASIPGAGISYQYDSRSLPVSLSRTNGVTSAYLFDKTGQLTSIVDAFQSSTLNTQRYGYDNVGNQSTATGALTQPLATTSSNATVNSGNELLTQGASTYKYDQNGNRTAESTPSGTTNYTWDGRNRLSKIMAADGSVVSLRYDFSRNLIGIGRLSAGISTEQQLTVDSLTNVVSLTDTAGSTTSILTGRSIDSVYGSVDEQGKSEFGLKDALGSINEVVDGTGQVLSKIHYEPYGGTSEIGSSIFPFRYTGHVPVYSNVYYSRNRYLDTTSGRFLSEDPSHLGGGDTVGTNPYSYAAANPLSNVDPTGLNCVATGDKVTCTPPGGQSVTFPRPAGWPDTIAPGGNYHSYDKQVDAPCIDPMDLKSGIADAPTPGYFPKAATANGTANNATPDPFYFPLQLFKNSPVISYLMPNGTVVNVTQLGHPLFPGYVERTVESKGSGSVVHNFGEGSGSLQKPGSLLAETINGVWTGQTNGIISGIKKKCGCH